MSRIEIVFKQRQMAGYDRVGESKFTRHLGHWEVRDGHARVLHRSRTCLWRSVENGTVFADDKMCEIESAAAAGRLQALRWVADSNLSADTRVIVDRPYYVLRKPPHEVTCEQLRLLLNN